MDTDEIFSSNKQSTSSNIQTSFSDRQKNLFDQLQKAEDVNKNRITTTETPREYDLNVDKSNNRSNKRKRSEMKYFQGKESIFKRPQEPLSKCLPVRKVPDFRKNPHKWTKYSLDDVRSEDTSEQGNTAAALSFLREMEERKSTETKDLEESTEFSKPQFNKSALVHRKNEENEKKIFKGSKIVMPEYVVGQSKKHSKKSLTKSSSQQTVKEVKLDHLLEYDDSED